MSFNDFVSSRIADLSVQMEVLKLNIPTLSSVISSRIYIKTSGVIELPPGLHIVLVTAAGGGGAGGLGSTNGGVYYGGGGGGAGASSMLTPIKLDPTMPTFCTVVIGDGGNSPSANGGDTSIIFNQGGNVVGSIVCHGGTGGQAGPVCSGGAGGQHNLHPSTYGLNGGNGTFGVPSLTTVTGGSGGISWFAPGGLGAFTWVVDGLPSLIGQNGQFGAGGGGSVPGVTLTGNGGDGFVAITGISQTQ